MEGKCCNSINTQIPLNLEHNFEQRMSICRIWHEIMIWDCLELCCGGVWIWLSWMPSNLYRYVNRASQRCEEAMWRCGVGREGGLSWNVTSDHLHLGGYLIWDPSMGSAKMSSWICEHSPNQERDWFVCIYFDLSKTRVFALLRPYALHCTNFHGLD